MSDKPQLIITGGGIAGLTAALACAKAGIRSRILERASVPPSHGAGIQIPPNAGRILAELGLDDAIAAHASEPAAIDIRNWRGAPLASLALGNPFRSRHGVAYRAIHRADLLGVLTRAAADEELIEVTFGCSLVHFEAAEDRVVVATDGASGGELTADALIGADGVGSAVRSALPGRWQSTPTGRAAWRAVLPADKIADGLARDRVSMWLGQHAHVVVYPVRQGREFNVVVGSGEHGATEPAFDVVRAALADWAAPLPALLGVAAEWRRWPIATVWPAHPWCRCRVALLGDAAHAMAPYLAQGGAMAIEDAAVLAHALAAKPSDVVAALQDYEAARRDRVAAVWRAAARTGAIYHFGPALAPFRNTAMAVLGNTRLAARYDWIYGWRPGETTRRPKAARSNAVKSTVS